MLDVQKRGEREVWVKQAGTENTRVKRRSVDRAEGVDGRKVGRNSRFGRCTGHKRLQGSRTADSEKRRLGGIGEARRKDVNFGWWEPAIVRRAHATAHSQNSPTRVLMYAGALPARYVGLKIL